MCALNSKYIFSKYIYMINISEYCRCICIMFERIRRHAMTLHGNVLSGVTVSKGTGLDLGQSFITVCLPVLF